MGETGEPVETQASSFRAELIVLKADWAAGRNASLHGRVQEALYKLLEGYSLPREQLAAIARQPTRFLFPDELAAFYRAEDWEVTLAWMRAHQLVMSQEKGEVDVEDKAGRPSRKARSRVELSLELEKSRWPAGIQTPSDPVRIKRLNSKYLLRGVMGGMPGMMPGMMEMGGMFGMMPGGMMEMGGWDKGMGRGWLSTPVNPSDRSDDAIHVHIESQLLEEEALHFPVTSTLDSRTLLHFGTALWLPAGHSVVIPWYGPRDTSLREKSLRDGADALLVIHAGRVAGGMNLTGMSDMASMMGGSGWLRRPQKLVPLKLTVAERSNIWDEERTDGMSMDPVEDPTTLAQTRRRYHRSERLAAEQASRARAIPDDDPRQAEALETLRQAVREAFARRLELQRLEATTLRQRLGRLETNLDQRETLSGEITARRVEQLLEDPATRWDADPAELNR